MSVLNPVGGDTLASWLSVYSLGGPVSLEPMPASAAGTRYAADLNGERCLLTLFEGFETGVPESVAGLMNHLAEQGLPVPRPIPTSDGDLLPARDGLTAMLTPAPPGAVVENIDAEHCAAVGTVLGRLHQTASRFADYRTLDRGPRWWRELSETLLPLLDAPSAELLNEEIRFQGLYRFSDAAQGIIHGNPIRAHLFFDGPTLTCMLGWEEAGRDLLLMDAALAVNHWCSEADGGIDFERLRALLAGYHAQRPLTPIERGAWPVVLRGAALRAWLLDLQGHGEETNGTGADHYARILQSRIDEEHALRRCWI